MILGLTIDAFTRLHVGIGLVAILAGLVMLLGMIGRRSLPAVTALFLLAAFLTSVTGYLFPGGIDAARIAGAVSLTALAAAAFALYGRRLAGAWRPAYAAAATLALYLDVFSLLAQAFREVPALVLLAPTRSEPPYVAAQAGTLVVLAILGALAALNFRAAPAPKGDGGGS